MSTSRIFDENEYKLQPLIDFIYKPLQEMNEEEIKAGADSVAFVLSRNPDAVMNILNQHAYIAVSYLLEDLADKMKKVGCLDKLELLFNRCYNEIIDSCSYNRHDLQRCLNALPSKSEEIIDRFLTDDDLFKRFFENYASREEALTDIESEYPVYYRAPFAECYERCFANNPAP